jgi:hypothetical protein
MSKLLREPAAVTIRSRDINDAVTRRHRRDLSLVCASLPLRTPLSNRRVRSGRRPYRPTGPTLSAAGGQVSQLISSATRIFPSLHCPAASGASNPGSNVGRPLCSAATTVFDYARSDRDRLVRPSSSRSYSRVAAPLLFLMPLRARRLASSLSTLNGTLQKGNSRISVMLRILRSTTNGNSAQTAGRSA